MEKLKEIIIESINDIGIDETIRIVREELDRISFKLSFSIPKNNYSSSHISQRDIIDIFHKKSRKNGYSHYSLYKHSVKYAFNNGGEGNRISASFVDANNYRNDNYITYFGYFKTYKQAMDYCQQDYIKRFILNI